MEKNIIVCWNMNGISGINYQIENIKKQKNETLHSIASHQSERTELRKTIESIINDSDDCDDVLIIKQIPKALKDTELYKLIMEDWANIPANEKDKKNAKLNIVIKREQELNKAKQNIIWPNYYNYNVTNICLSFKDFQKVLENTEKIDGLIVLCELDWDDYDSTDDLKGITLVQRYIRYEKKIKAPVVFTSFFKKENILSYLKQEDSLSQRPDADIISTPALQHKFIRFSKDVIDLFNGFRDMKNMTKRQLDYTIDRFCDLKGLLSHIKHNVHGCSDDSLNSYKAQLLYAVKKLFDNNADKISEVNAASTDKDLENICHNYITELQHYNKTANIRITDYICDTEDKQLRTLILDDNPNDDYTTRLVYWMNQINDKVSQSNNYCCIAKPVVVRNVDDFFNEIGTDSYYNNIILDVELWNEHKELEALGFDIAEEVITRRSVPMQINLITNTTRSLYPKLINNTKNSIIRGIYLKEEILSSDLQTIRFINNINKEWNDYINFYSKRQYQCNNAFQRLICTVIRRMPDNVKIEFDINKLSDTSKSNFRTYLITNYDELEVTVKDLSLKLIQRFLTECQKTNNSVITWLDFDTICATMRELIANTIGLGNEKLISKLVDKNIRPNANDIINFTKRLVLRRFFLYLKLFIKHHEIMRRFEDDRKKHKYREDVKWRYRDADLACRAISKQFKRPFIDKEYNTSKQSKCLTETLLYSIKIDEKDQLSEEEKAFVEAVIKNKDSYNYNANINNLTFEY